MKNQTFQDVLSLFSISPDTEKAAINCPVCDGYRKLDINLGKQVFRCAKCGVSGKKPISLYMVLSGENDPQKASKEMTKAINGGETIGHINITERKTVLTEQPLREIEERNDIYQILMGELYLSDIHKGSLMKRGLDYVHFDKYGLKSLPETEGAARYVAGKIQALGYNLLGVPGFYVENNGFQFPYGNGILIPCKNALGQIEGIQIRMDKPRKNEPRYKWFSSAGKEYGTPAKTFTHIAGDIQRSMILTEGPLKADIINAFTGRGVIAVPGVNSLSYLIRDLSILKEKGLEEVNIAYDMDMYSNEHVMSAYKKLSELLVSEGLNVKTLKWDKNFKGLDDYLLDLKLKGRS